MWQVQVEAFSPHYETICYDQRGFGRTRLLPGAFSYHEDVAAVLDHLGHERANIVAISFGGRVALDFALAYPQRVSALVLGAPSVSGQVDSPRVQQFVKDEDEALERGDIDGAVELNLRLWVDGPQRRPHQVDAGVRRLVGQMQRNAFLVPEPDGVTLKPPPPPVIERLQDIDIPVLLITGALDLEEKNALAERLARDLPDVRRLSLPAAHMMSLEQPSAFNEAVLSFLRHVSETA
jgi:pimeloyl-ACP methyl ester carboxylesterase